MRLRSVFKMRMSNLKYSDYRADGIWYGFFFRLHQIYRSGLSGNTKVVKAKKKGKAVIAVQSGSKTVKCKVTVK